eukprot:m51a1_g4398 putative dna polymerase iii subunit epsilon (330) ;mRNA; r:385411-386544
MLSAHESQMDLLDFAEASNAPPNSPPHTPPGAQSPARAPLPFDQVDTEPEDADVTAAGDDVINAVGDDDDVARDLSAIAGCGDDDEDTIDPDDTSSQPPRPLPGWMATARDRREALQRQAQDARALKDSARCEAEEEAAQRQQGWLRELGEAPRAGRVVCFDVETTGFGPGDRVVEYGAVELVDGLRTGALFQSYARAPAEVHPMAHEAHGISDDVIARAPPPGFVAASFLDWVGASPLVAYNAAFDTRMLEREMEDAGLTTESRGFWCAMKMFKSARPGMASGLGDAAAALEIPAGTFHRAAHGALVDAELLAVVYQRLLEHTNKQAS